MVIDENAYGPQGQFSSHDQWRLTAYTPDGIHNAEMALRITRKIRNGWNPCRSAILVPR